MKNVCFTASETVQIPVEEQEIPIRHYLRQPQRLVNAIAEPQLMTPLTQDRYSLRMRPLNFMDLYRLQPTVVLKVWTSSEGTVYLKSESCEIRGIDYINDRFSLSLAGQLSPCEQAGTTYLKGKADLQVNVELPPLLWLTPAPLLEMTGNALLKSVLVRIKQRLLGHLLADYRQWSNSQSRTKTATHLGNVWTG
ncbi:DUF1997 domain-containing protein [Oscillatoria sp. FACHB-1406]|uniref:DUF1997 domain-containing protein n=1 Tax=Oscillatoria sp. FACHB-1406 TaxID=2692846 RepID=UPI0016899F78|nr:DUF1997 domain-containing protein [Oscillatoria sp. FACHB-1406]MBD2576781.1 DUF1997 domain-containing protein [Oscillatoria sp. FACHB-1406]